MSNPALSPSLASVEALQQALHDVFAPWVRELGLRVEAATLGEVPEAAHATTTYALL